MSIREKIINWFEKQSREYKMQELKEKEDEIWALYNSPIFQKASMLLAWEYKNQEKENNNVK